jgi:hypothetical protein
MLSNPDPIAALAQLSILPDFGTAHYRTFGRMITLLITHDAAPIISEIPDSAWYQLAFVVRFQGRNMAATLEIFGDRSFAQSIADRIEQHGVQGISCPDDAFVNSTTFDRTIPFRLVEQENLDKSCSGFLSPYSNLSEQ